MSVNRRRVLRNWCKGTAITVPCGLFLWVLIRMQIPPLFEKTYEGTLVRAFCVLSVIGGGFLAYMFEVFNEQTN